MARFNVNAPDGSVIPVDAPDGATEQDAIAFAASTWKPSKQTTVAAPSEKPGILSNLGASSASLADNTIGGVLPLLGQVVYPIVRPFTTPKRAEEIGNAISSAVDKPFGKAFGVTESPAYKSEGSRQLLDFIGANIGKGADWVSGKTGLPVEDVRNMMGTSLLAVPATTRGGVNAVEAVKPVVRDALITLKDTPVGQAITRPLVERAARVQEQRVAKSYTNATTIDATDAAHRLGASVNPAVSNPTVANRLKGVAAGPETVETELSKYNSKAVTDKVRQEIGAKPNERLMPEIDETTGKLNTDSPITRALNDAGKPYDVIRKMGSLDVPAESISALQSLKRQATIGGDAKTSAVNAVVDDAIAKLQQTTTGAFSGVGGGPVRVGRSGAMILEDIRQLRRDANAIQRAQKINPDPSAIAKADTQKAIAGVLEDIVDSNAPSPKVLSDLKAARTKIAQIYEHEAAFDYGLQKVDPQAYVKMYQDRKGAMTGTGADIAKAASSFPSSFTLSPATEGKMPRFVRSGLGGLVGAGLGSAVGQPVAGIALGTGVGAIAGKSMARRIATPEYQAKHAAPIDYRPEPNMLRPVEPNATVNSLVPYDYGQTATVPPNWVPGRPDAVVTTPGVDQGAPRIPMSQGTVGGQMGALRAEDARVRDLSMRQGAEAEAAQAASEKASRKPASGAVVYDLDPVTGELVPASSTLKRATPNTQVVESTGHSLRSASEKIQSGRLFDMTPEERISWGRTRVDIAESIPDLKSLSDREIAGKMMDRQWVAETIANLRQKDEMFKAQATRNLDKLRQQDKSFKSLEAQMAFQEKVRDAAAKRADLISTLEDAQDRLSGGRPAKRSGQGPVTRDAIRNKLIQDVRNKNSLRNE